MPCLAVLVFCPGADWFRKLSPLPHPWAAHEIHGKWMVKHNLTYSRLSWYLSWVIRLTDRQVAVWVMRTVKFAIFILEMIYFSGCSTVCGSFLAQVLFFLAATSVFCSKYLGRGHYMWCVKASFKWKMRKESFFFFSSESELLCVQWVGSFLMLDQMLKKSYLLVPPHSESSGLPSVLEVKISRMFEGPVIS